LANTPPIQEPNAAGNRPSGLWTPGSIASGVNIDLPGLTQASTQINSVTSALYGLKAALRDVGSGSYMLAQGVNNLFQGITRSAQQTASAITGVSQALGSVSSGGGGGTSGGGGGTAGAGRGVPAWVGQATTSAGAGSAASGGGGPTAPPGNISLTSSMLGMNPSAGVEPSFWKNLALFPLRFIRDQVDINRQTALSTETALSRTAFASGANFTDVYNQLSRRPGNIQGTVADLNTLFANAPGYGAMYNFAGGANAPRTAGYLAGVREAQMITPGAPVAQIAGTIGGQASNVASQQAAQMLTGGAFGMIKSGGGQKSLTEWAESVLKWLEGMRGGPDRGKPFDYGQLIAQYFPGSNIDAWFEQTGVSQDMREYWWSYALRKAQSFAGTSQQGRMEITPSGGTTPAGGVMWNRLKATSQLTTGQFGLASQMAGAYSNKEQANQWFNRLMSDFTRTMVPSAVGAGNLNFMQFLPDTVEQMLMQLLERSGKAGTGIGAMLGYGNLFADKADQSVASSLLSGVWDFFEPNIDIPGIDVSDILGGAYDFVMPNWPWGDVGDVGDNMYSTTGGTGTAGMHPDMKRKVGKMMKANPRLRINSGLRDNRMQQTLKKRGVGRVSGKPSAHTRGMAADLGPPSQYNWLVKNASKFGLKSGVGAGEPWHVGMGDVEGVGDVWDDFLSAFPLLGGFENIITNENRPEGTISGVSTVVNTVFDLLRGMFTGSDASATDISSGLVQLPDLFSQLMAKSATWGTVGGIIATNHPDADTTTSSTSTDSDVSVLSSDDSPGTVTQQGINAAKALYNAGFKEKLDLTKIVAIAKRESGWDPTQENPNGEDKGLMQINIKAHRDRIASLGYSSADMMNIQKNANTAYDIYSDSGKSFMAWNFSEKSIQWGLPPRPGWAPADNQARGGGIASPFIRTNLEEAGNVVEAADLPGLGDIEQGYLPVAPSTPRNGALLQFNNTFHISGNGGGGGIDLRRTVTMIADHLEDEMNNRLLRAS